MKFGSKANKTTIKRLVYAYHFATYVSNIKEMCTFNHVLPWLMNLAGTRYIIPMTLARWELHAKRINCNNFHASDISHRVTRSVVFCYKYFKLLWVNLSLLDHTDVPISSDKLLEYVQYMSAR